jgi:hypothetical protein
MEGRGGNAGRGAVADCPAGGTGMPGEEGRGGMKTGVDGRAAGVGVPIVEGRGGAAGGGGGTAGRGGGAAGETTGVGVAGTAGVIGGVGAVLMVSGGGVAFRAAAGVNSSADSAPWRVIAMTPPHTAHRARTEAPGIFPGSMRKTDRHSGQATFIAAPFRRGSRAPRSRPLPPPRHPSGGRW